MNAFAGKLHAVIIMLIFLITFVPGCESPPSLPVSVNITFSDLPVLNKPVKITATFTLTTKTYGEQAKNVTAQIILPEGFHKVDGDLTWKGDLSPGVTQALSATIKSVKIGTEMIEARADYDIPGAHLGGSATKYITVTDKSTTVSDRPPAGGNITWASPYGSQTPNPYASPISTLPSPKPVEPWQLPTPSVPAHSS